MYIANRGWYFSLGSGWCHAWCTQQALTAEKQTPVEDDACIEEATGARNLEADTGTIKKDGASDEGQRQQLLRRDLEDAEQLTRAFVVDRKLADFILAGKKAK